MCSFRFVGKFFNQFGSWVLKIKVFDFILFFHTTED